jgi:hypothetical protein
MRTLTRSRLGILPLLFLVLILGSSQEKGGGDRCR